MVKREDDDEEEDNDDVNDAAITHLPPTTLTITIPSSPAIIIHFATWIPPR